MSTRWRTVELVTSPAETTVELLLIAGPPYGCLAPQRFPRQVLDVVERAGRTVEYGQSFELLVNDCTPRTVLALGIGTAQPSDTNRWVSLGGSLVEAMNKRGLASVRLPGSDSLGGDHVFEALVLGALLHSFEFSMATTRREVGATPEFLVIDEADVPCAARAQRYADAINRARAWVQQPPNILTPSQWAAEICSLFVSTEAVVRVLEPPELERLGAGGLLAVARGSEHGARLVAVEWRGRTDSDAWDAALVGKGLTFDSGGLNLKPSPQIARMKLDMAGGASVLAGLELAVVRRAAVNVVAIVPIAENAIDALGYRPSDIVTSLSGKTIEVANTDCEGRLALADALTYAVCNYQPSWIVDVATLTTSVARVLHEEFAAVYSTSNRLAQQLLQAGELVGERLWRMPLDSVHNYLVESEVADLCNAGPPGYFGVGAGSPTAGAKFLQVFAQDAEWAHLDITGTCWSTRRTIGSRKGPTGFGARLLDRWLSLIEPDTRAR